MNRKCLSWTLLFVLTLSLRAGAEDTQIKGSDLKGFMPASATVDAFLKAMVESDLEAVMKTVDVPWFHDGRKIVESEDELRDLFRQPTDEKKLAGLQAEIKEVQLFEAVREKSTGTSGELLKSIAKDDDLVFIISTKIGTKSDEVLLLVRVKNDGAKIIGLRN